MQFSGFCDSCGGGRALQLIEWQRAARALQIDQNSAAELKLQPCSLAFALAQLASAYMPLAARNFPERGRTSASDATASA